MAYKSPCVTQTHATECAIVVKEKRTNIPVDSRTIALAAARAADGKMATDIIIQDVQDLFKVTDYFVIVTGQNNRQVDAIADEVEEKLREDCGVKPIGQEGRDDCSWILLDYGDVIVHIFQPAIREFYRLETLWNDAPIIDVAQADIEHPPYSERIGKIAGRA